MFPHRLLLSSTLSPFFGTSLEASSIPLRRADWVAERTGRGGLADADPTLVAVAVNPALIESSLALVDLTCC